MVSKEYKVEVFQRDVDGKRSLKQLRNDGYVPGVFYARDVEGAIHFKVAIAELHAALQGEALIYHISVGGKRRNVLVREIQYHPVTDEILHVDFYGVRMDEQVEIAVPVILVGRPIGVKDEGGHQHHALLEVDVRCLAAEVPARIEVDVSDMHLGDAIHAGDLDLGGAELVTSPDVPVVSVARPRGVGLEEAAEVEEGEAFEFEDESGEGKPSEEKASESER